MSDSNTVEVDVVRPLIVQVDGRTYVLHRGKNVVPAAVADDWLVRENLTDASQNHIGTLGETKPGVVTPKGVLPHDLRTGEVVADEVTAGDPRTGQPVVKDDGARLPNADRDNKKK